MKISILQENLLKATQDALRFISTKPQLPILSSFLFEVKNHELVISATDLRVGMRTIVGGKIDEDGEFALPAKVFVEYLASLSAGPLELEVVDNELVVRSEKTKASFQGVTVKDFPPFPKKEGGTVEIKKELFVSLIQKGGIAASMDETRPAFSSILLGGDGESLSAVSTDGYRLSKQNVPFSGWEVGEILLPAKTIQDMIRIIDKLKVKDVEITVSQELGQVFFSAGDTLFLVRLIEASFPAYKNIIPEEFTTQISFSREEFLGALKTAMIFSRENSGIIKFALGKDELTLQSSSNVVGKSESSVDVKNLKGESQEIAFNGKYIQDLFSSITGEEIWFGMNENLKPGMFKIVGDEHFFYLLMPFRMQGENA